ncbi:DsbC family protein [Wohlfahrtiimonas chitiniclastica]|uniref:DsbC family protein n=1 Tax=Wohlfahrtiimonas chitiniclastica TaxID=400946 RepID=UPI001BCE9C01|nr:DsbC family protein [Wohlfahrtiimonas chitiniclastica]MBS7814684.1 DsbC family protein [Wohlfahrtiimonas chitiniclastica]
MRKIAVAMGLLAATTAVSFAKPDLSHIQEVLGGMKVEKAVPSDVKGVYELYIEDVNLPLYLSADGRYLIEGQITDLVNRVNLTENRQNTIRTNALDKIDVKDMIVYPAKGDKKNTITVFTDVNCPYCKKLHDEIPKYNDAGIEVRYLAFPAIATKTRMESVWCSKDPKATVDAAMHKRAFDTNVKCTGQSPVEAQYQLGMSFGITGTPNIILDNGQMIGGYVPAAELIHLINSTEK